MTEPERHFLIPDDAISALADGDEVHTFRGTVPGVLIGCDLSRATAAKMIREAKFVEVAGPGAMGMGHGIAVTCDKGTTFFAHKPGFDLDGLPRAVAS